MLQTQDPSGHQPVAWLFANLSHYNSAPLKHFISSQNRIKGALFFVLGYQTSYPVKQQN